MSSIIKHNLATLLDVGNGSLRSCLEQAKLRARNGRETRMVGFRYEGEGGILQGSFTLDAQIRCVEMNGYGNIELEYDTSTLAVRILRIYISERSSSAARRELEFTKQAYNGLHASR